MLIHIHFIHPSISTPCYILSSRQPGLPCTSWEAGWPVKALGCAQCNWGTHMWVPHRKTCRPPCRTAAIEIWTQDPLRTREPLCGPKHHIWYIWITSLHLNLLLTSFQKTKQLHKLHKGVYEYTRYPKLQ